MAKPEALVLTLSEALRDTIESYRLHHEELLSEFLIEHREEVHSLGSSSDFQTLYYCLDQRKFMMTLPYEEAVSLENLGWTEVHYSNLYNALVAFQKHLRELTRDLHSSDPVPSSVGDKDELNTVLMQDLRCSNLGATEIERLRTKLVNLNVSVSKLRVSKSTSAFQVVTITSETGKTSKLELFYDSESEQFSYHENGPSASVMNLLNTGKFGVLQEIIPVLGLLVDRILEEQKTQDDLANNCLPVFVEINDHLDRVLAKFR